MSGQPLLKNAAVSTENQVAEAQKCFKSLKIKSLLQLYSQYDTEDNQKMRGRGGEEGAKLLRSSIVDL